MELADCKTRSDLAQFMAVHAPAKLSEQPLFSQVLKAGLQFADINIWTERLGHGRGILQRLASNPNAEPEGEFARRVIEALRAALQNGRPSTAVK